MHTHAYDARPLCIVIFVIIALSQVLMKHGLSREKQAAQLDVYGGNHTLMPQPTAPNLLLRHMLHPFAFLCVFVLRGRV